MLLSLAPQSCSRNDLLERFHNKCPFSVLRKILLIVYSLIEPMNYLVNALAVIPVSAQTPRDVQGSCETEIDDDLSIEETDEQGDDDGHPVEEEETTTRTTKDTQTSPQTVTKERKSVARTKTRLHLCHPPPSAKQKRLRTRPRILLQLQRKSKETRPVPTYDVLSTTAFTSRFAQELPNTLKGKGAVGGEEQLAVVKSEDYSNKDVQTDDFDDVLQDDARTREVVATIAHHGADESGGLGGADICIGKDRTWVATPMVKGGYEFVTVEETGHRLVARWVPRKRSRTRSDGRRSTSPLRLPERKAFNFSLLDPHSRRHAVIATFDAQELEILDRYSSPKAGANNRLSMSTLDTSSMTNEKDLKEVDEGLRRLIVASSVWVSYCEGFISSLQTPTESPRAKVVNETLDRRKSLLVDSRDWKKEKTSLERASSVQSLMTATSPVNTPITTPTFSIPTRRTQSTGSPILNQSHGRQSLPKRAETMYPIFDTDTEASPLESRTSLEDEAGASYFQEQLDLGLPTIEEKKGKRSKSIKKLCRSLKKSERTSSSS